MSGNWDEIPFRLSGGSRRRRIVLTVASIAALLVLVYLAGSFFGTPDHYPGEVLVVVGLLVAGTLWGLRPWAK